MKRITLENIRSTLEDMRHEVTIDQDVAADGALWANTCERIFRFDGQRFHPIAGLSGMLSGTERMTNDARGHGMMVARDTRARSLLPALSPSRAKLLVRMPPGGSGRQPHG